MLYTGNAQSLNGLAREILTRELRHHGYTYPPVVVPVESRHSFSCNCELVLFCGSSMPPFEKKCPECGNTVHVRKLNCSCGYGFSRKSKRSLTSKNSIKQSVEANEKRKKADASRHAHKKAHETDHESEKRRQANASCQKSP